MILSNFKLLSLSACILVSNVYAQQTNNEEPNLEKQADQEACISDYVKNADSSLTVGQLRNLCSEENASAINERRSFEQSAINNPYILLPHKTNYILPVTYFDANQDVYEDLLQGYELDDVEVKFQFSIKYIVSQDLFVSGTNLAVAFTTVSWWQAYNNEISAPFRETNYEPELIFSYDKPWDFFQLPVMKSFVSLNHQSNGESGSLSRSWNRIIGGLVFEHENFIWSIDAWWRIPEDAKNEPTEPGGDDNADIEEFMGNGQLGALWKLPGRHNLDIMLRNNLRSDNKGAVELGWSFPFTYHLRGYVQYFNGYGESLIYYNQSTERIGIGVKLTDWL